MQLKQQKFAKEKTVRKHVQRERKHKTKETKKLPLYYGIVLLARYSISARKPTTRPRLKCWCY
jgi:hypothetical protein